jgi:hypothetical protein
MRYLTIYRPTGGVEGGMPSPQHMADMGRLIEEMMAKGVLETTGPLAQRSDCVRVTMADGQFTTADETVRAGGYAFLHAGSKGEVIEHVKTFLKVAGDGTCEIRLVPDMGAPPAA